MVRSFLVLVLLAGCSNTLHAYLPDAKDSNIRLDLYGVKCEIPFRVFIDGQYVTTVHPRGCGHLGSHYMMDLTYLPLRAGDLVITTDPQVEISKAEIKVIHNDD